MRKVLSTVAPDQKMTKTTEAPSTKLLNESPARPRAYYCKRACALACLVVALGGGAMAARFYLRFSRGMAYMRSEKAAAVPIGNLTLNGHRLSWYKLNDVVMGGHSSSAIRATDDGALNFFGNISTRDGGFSSCSTVDAALGLPATATALRIDVTTDGAAYTFAIKTSDSVWEPQWQLDLPAASLVPRVRHTLELPFSAFRASRMGRPVPDAAPLVASHIRSIGLSLALVDDRGRPRHDHFGDGPFSLTLHSVGVVVVPGASPPAAAAAVTLVRFDASAPTARAWRVTDDPVMGGRSRSSFTTDAAQHVGHFAGTCAVVPFLRAPGFCKVSTSGGAYADASRFIGGALLLTLRSRTPTYAGYKVAFTAAGMPPARHGGGHHSSPSFKADLALPAAAAAGFVQVRVPFDAFSVDWSEYTGRCDTTDPTGTQHVCCSAKHPEVCPRAAHLGAITGMSVWAEGVEGDFDLELREIAAGA